MFVGYQCQVLHSQNVHFRFVGLVIVKHMPLLLKCRRLGMYVHIFPKKMVSIKNWWKYFLNIASRINTLKIVLRCRFIQN